MSHYTFHSTCDERTGFFSSLIEATVELSLDSSPQDEKKKDVTAKPSASSLSAATSLTKPQSADLEEVHEYLIKEICFISPRFLEY